MSTRIAIRSSAVVLLSAIASSQVSERWSAEIEGASSAWDTQAFACAIAPNGDVVLTGDDRFASTGTNSHRPITARFDRNGTLLWTRIDEGAQPPTQGRSVAIDPFDGSAYVAASLPAPT